MVQTMLKLVPSHEPTLQAWQNHKNCRHINVPTVTETRRASLQSIPDLVSTFILTDLRGSCSRPKKVSLSFVYWRRSNTSNKGRCKAQLGDICGACRRLEKGGVLKGASRGT